MTVRALRRGSIAASRVTGPPPVNTLVLPGLNTDYVATPDTAANSVATIDVRMDVAPTTWLPTGSGALTSRALMAKWPTSGTTNRGWIFLIDNSTAVAGALTLYYSTTGSNFLVATSTAGVAFADGSRHWVRVVKNGTSCSFYTSDDGSAWTQLGTTVAVTTGLFNTTRPLEIGKALGPTPFDGSVYKGQLLDASTTTLVNSFDATAVTKLGTRNPTTVVASTGETWTMNGTGWDWVAA